ncbi:MAG: YicC/YloC family endoribonuclease [Planctomycetota bacterium]
MRTTSTRCVRSMTGFGRASQEQGPLAVEVEIRSVNNRHLGCKHRLPVPLLRYEKQFEDRIRKRATRGYFDVFVRFLTARSPVRPLIDTRLAGKYLTVLRAFLAEQGFGPHLAPEFVLGLPGVITTVEEDVGDQALGLALKALDVALAHLIGMREAEGERLARELEGHSRAVQRFLERIQKRSLSVPREYQRRLRERVTQLLGEGPIGPDDEGLRREVAYLAERADIAEEIARLRSHLEHFAELLDGGGAIGRSLEFVVQEMGREVNTIGSKASDARISRAVVELKAELEKIREQVQNIE